MLRLCVVMAGLLQVSFAAPQFVSFKDGKVGVNFGGYHASAGLGGLLTGNAAHGGLSASAGTPWGPQAAAGINGGVDGRTAGVLYAGAEANPAVGASAVLGGSAGEGGFGGSEAHANGKAVSKTYSGVAAVAPGVDVSSGPLVGTAAVEPTNTIQKIKPPKKYTLLKNEHHVNVDANVAHSKQLVKSVQDQAPPSNYYVPRPVVQQQSHPQYASETGVRVHHDTGLVGNVLNIPIGILRSLQESLAGISVDKSISLKQSAF